MAIREPQQASVAGVTPTYNAASGGGDKIRPGTRGLIKNGSGAPITATLVTPGTAFGQAIGDQAITVAAGGEKDYVVPAQGFEGTDGYCDITWSAVTTVTFSSFRN